MKYRDNRLQLEHCSMSLTLADDVCCVLYLSHMSLTHKSAVHHSLSHDTDKISIGQRLLSLHAEARLGKLHACQRRCYRACSVDQR